MSLSFIGQATGTTSATLPSFQQGDLAVVFAFRDGSTTAPSLPAGWQSILTRGTTTSCSQRVGFRWLMTGNTTTGTWTNATSVVVLIYRSSTSMAYIGGSAANGGTTNTANFPAVTFKRTDGTSWAVGFIGHRSTNQNIETAPSGMTNRANVVDATDEASGHDTNGGVTGWSSTNQTLTGTASGWQSSVIEIVEAVAGDVVNAVQAANSAAGTTLALAEMVTRPGNLLALVGSWGTTDVTPTVTDSGTESFTEIGTHFWNSNAQILQGLAMFYAKNLAGGANTITLNYGSSVDFRIFQCLEIYGMDTSAPLDGTVGNGSATAGSGTDNATSTTRTPGVNNCLLVGGCVILVASPTMAAGTGWTERLESAVQASLAIQGMETKLQSSATNEAALWSVTNGADYHARVAAFKPPGGSQFQQATSDTISLTEARQAQARKALSETLALTEGMTQQSRKTILETVALTESMTRFVTHPLADSLGASENLQAVKVILRDVSDTISLGEQVRLAVSKRSDLAETVALTEALARATGRSLAETVNLAENLAAIKLILRPVADTLLISEHLGVLVKKASGLSETVLLAESQARQTGKGFADTLSFTENLAALRAILASRADALSLSETVSRLVTRATAESVSLTETDQQTVRKTIAELSSFTEQLVAQVVQTKSFSETVALTESQRRAIGKAIQDVLGLTETRIVAIARQIQEAITLQEVFTPQFLAAGGSFILARVSRETYRPSRAVQEGMTTVRVTSETFLASG